jgi:hypothetical protein
MVLLFPLEKRKAQPCAVRARDYRICFPKGFPGLRKLQIIKSVCVVVRKVPTVYRSRVLVRVSNIYTHYQDTDSQPSFVCGDKTGYLFNTALARGVNGLADARVVTLT